MQISANHTAYARKRAVLAAAGFALWGALGAWFFIIQWHQSWPLVLFYIILVLNTFFSVRTFASITPPQHIGQQLWDGLLVIFFLAMPLQFHSPLSFTLLATGLFIISVFKYVSLFPVVGFSPLLYAKIRINTLGVLLCVAAVIGVLSGHPLWSSILWTGIFLFANVYILWWQPLYRLDMHRSYEKHQK